MDANPLTEEFLLRPNWLTRKSETGAPNAARSNSQRVRRPDGISPPGDELLASNLSPDCLSDLATGDERLEFPTLLVPKPVASIPGFNCLCIRPKQAGVKRPVFARYWIFTWEERASALAVALSVGSPSNLGVEPLLL